eukprot:6200459-Pleurochrysis_carterae.AAC.1
MVVIETDAICPSAIAVCFQSLLTPPLLWRCDVATFSPSCWSYPACRPYQGRPTAPPAPTSCMLFVAPPKSPPSNTS